MLEMLLSGVLMDDVGWWIVGVWVVSVRGKNWKLGGNASYTRRH
jgi:hypothetical protein